MNKTKEKKFRKKSIILTSLNNEQEKTLEENEDQEIKQLHNLVKSYDLDDDTDSRDLNKVINQIELLKNISSTSLNKPNSKIFGEILCDLSSLSSQNTLDAKMDLSERDIQRTINLAKKNQKEMKSKDYKIRKRITFDYSYLKTCSFYKQLFILILNSLILLDCSYILSVLSESEKEKKTNAILQIIVASTNMIILSIIILFYLFNFVGKFSQESWLNNEFYIYLVFTIFFFFNTILLFIFGHRFILQAIFNIFIFLNFFGLAMTKLMMAHLKITAQQHVEDPDGNFERTKQLNARFTYTKRNLLRIWTV